MHKIRMQNLVNLYIDKKSRGLYSPRAAILSHIQNFVKRKMQKNTQNPFLNFVHFAYLLFGGSVLSQLEGVSFALVIERIFDLIFH